MAAKPPFEAFETKMQNTQEDDIRAAIAHIQYRLAHRIDEYVRTLRKEYDRFEKTRSALHGMMLHDFAMLNTPQAVTREQARDLVRHMRAKSEENTAAVHDLVNYVLYLRGELILDEFRLRSHATKLLEHLRNASVASEKVWEEFEEAVAKLPE